MEKVVFNALVLEFKGVNGLAPDYLGKHFIKRSAVHNKNTRGCNNLWSPNVDCQWGKGHFIFRVQGNGMGYLTILKTLKTLIVLSGHFLIIYFIRNNFECILNLTELL